MHQKKRYWDNTISGNAIMASRTSILETLRYVVKSPPEIKAKSTISSFALFFFDLKTAIIGHPIWTALILILIGFPVLVIGRRRMRSRRGGFFKLDEKNGLLGGFGGAGSNGKAD
jgi:protein disulfide-isomerase